MSMAPVAFSSPHSHDERPAQAGLTSPSPGPISQAEQKDSDSYSKRDDDAPSGNAPSLN